MSGSSMRGAKSLPLETEARQGSPAKQSSSRQRKETCSQSGHRAGGLEPSEISQLRGRKPNTLTERCDTFKEQRLRAPHRSCTCGSVMLAMCSSCSAVQQQTCADQTAIPDADSFTALATKLSKAEDRTNLSRPDCVGARPNTSGKQGWSPWLTHAIASVPSRWPQPELQHEVE